MSSSGKFLHSFNQSTHQSSKQLLGSVGFSMLKKLVAKGISKNVIIKKESYKGLYVISGQQCQVQADIINGKVVGCFSMKRSNKNFKFDFKPHVAKNGFDIYFELSRIYLDQLVDKNGKTTVGYCIRDCWDIKTTRVD